MINRLTGRCIVTWNWKKAACGIVLKLESKALEVSQEFFNPEEELVEVNSGTTGTLIVYFDQAPSWLRSIEASEPEHRLTVVPLATDEDWKKITCARVKVLKIQAGGREPFIKFKLYPRLTRGGRPMELFRFIGE